MNELDRQEWIEEAVEEVLETWRAQAPEGLRPLSDSIRYSYQKGGKRFRPILAVLIAETLAVHPKKVLPWALAVEMIHTYSLIHDDLPCMDNDDFRRGLPTNHKVFGETTALLAGDALLTEAFSWVAGAYSAEPALGLQLVSLLGKAAGLFGMVGGQALDLSFQKKKPSFEDLEKMHALKTGALIRVSAEGAALICGLPSEQVSHFRKFGENLGLAFQIKDDLLDAQDREELGSFPSVIGYDATLGYLNQISEKSLQALKQAGLGDKGPLPDLIQFNLHREK